jgi:hypothetical protein
MGMKHFGSNPDMHFQKWNFDQIKTDIEFLLQTFSVGILSDVEFI